MSEKRAQIAAALTAVLMIAASPKARAGCKLIECTQAYSGDSVMSVSGMHFMEGDKWVVQAAPGYFSSNVHELVSTGVDVPVSGFDGALAVKREFSPHWGAGVGGSFSLQTGGGGLGTQTSGFAPPAAATAGDALAGGQIKNMYGNAIFAAVTYDPFSSPDGFRLPLSIGPLYMWQGFQFSNTVGNQTETVNASRSFVGVYANASVDVPLGKGFYVMPGIQFGGSPRSNPLFNYTYTVTKAGTTTNFTGLGDYMSEFFTTIFASVAYRPWDVSINYVFIDGSSGSGRNFSLTLTKKWKG